MCVQPVVLTTQVAAGLQNFIRAAMRNMDEIRNPALRNRPTEEHTKEVLEIIRKRAEEDLRDSNVHFDEALLRRVSVTRRPNEPLPSIRVGNDPEEHHERQKRQSCPTELDTTQTETGASYRWRSLSDAPLAELRNRSPRDRGLRSPASDTAVSQRHGRTRRMSNNLPPLESTKGRFERPNCVPSIHRNGVLILPKDAKDINGNYESEDVFTGNGIEHH